MSHGRDEQRERADEPAPYARDGRRPFLGAPPAAWFALALIGLVTFVAYYPALRGGFLWDDDAHITRQELQSVEGLGRIWTEIDATQQYYPLLHSAFWLEYRLWGDATSPYHLVNVALHCVAVVLFYFVLIRLKVPGALLAAAIFALHPVMVESVAWITEQKNTLSTVFYLSATLAYLSFDSARMPRYYAVALLLFVLGLLSKTVIVTLPAALLVIAWWQRGRLSWRRDVLPLVPFFLLGAASGLLTAWVEHELIGAKGEAFNLSPAARVLLAGQVIWFYLAKLLWPANLIFLYPKWIVDSAVWWQWIFPLAAVALTVALWSIRTWSRAPLAAWLLFVGTLFPVLGFFNVYPFRYSFVADHFQYLPSLSVIALVAGALAAAYGRLSPSWQRAELVLCFILVLALACLTRLQAEMYRDAKTLYFTTIGRNPGCWMAYNNLAAMLPLDQALDYSRKALELKPDYAEAHNNLGNSLLAMGNDSGAIEEYQRALQLDPNDAGTRNNLANALQLQKKTAAAIEQYEIVLKLKPDYSEAHANLAVALRSLGRLEESIEEDRQALRWNPNNYNALANLALGYAAQGRRAEALAAAEEASQLAHSRGDEPFVTQITGWLQNYRATTEETRTPP